MGLQDPIASKMRPMGALPAHLAFAKVLLDLVLVHLEAATRHRADVDEWRAIRADD
jgi:hypothetical protein